MKTRWRVVTPAAVLSILVLVLPVSLPKELSSVSDQECLTIADGPGIPAMALTKVLERCSSLHPDHVELLADLGVHYEAAGALNRAEQVYERALVIDPAYADLRLRLGRLLLNRGEASEARHQAELALRIQPNRRALLDLLSDADRHHAGEQP